MLQGAYLCGTAVPGTSDHNGPGSVAQPASISAAAAQPNALIILMGYLQISQVRFHVAAVWRIRRQLQVQLQMRLRLQVTPLFH